MRRAALVLLMTSACTQSAPPPSVSLPMPLPSPPAPESTIALRPFSKPSFDAADFSSEKGIVHLRDGSGGVVAGAFGSSGVMTCNRSPESLECRWYENSDRGRAVFHRRPSGKLEGTWGSGESADDGGSWTLVPIASTEGGPEGVWDSNFVPATITRTSSGLHVEYRDGTMECDDRQPKKLACDWTEGSANGKAELTIESSRVLRGHWGNGTSSSDGGSWLFVRR